MPLEKVRAADNPVDQFNGPVVSTLLSLKYSGGGDGAMASTLDSMVNILYGADNEELITYVTRDMSVKDRDLFTASLATASSLTPCQKLRSIEYINYFLSYDPDVFRVYKDIDVNEDALDSVMEFYAPEEHPIPSIESLHSIRLPEHNVLSAYGMAYGVYSGITGTYGAGDENLYDVYTTESPYGYKKDEFTISSPEEALGDLIDKVGLSMSGFRLKDGETFSSAEKGVIFSKMFKNGAPSPQQLALTAMSHNRSTTDYIRACISEAAKVEKSIVRKFVRS